MDKPIDRRRLAKRDGIPARGRATRQQVNLLDIKLDSRTEPRLVRENGRFQLAVELGANGVDVRQPFPNPKPVPVDRESIGAHLSVRDLDGERPRGVETRFAPEMAPRTHRRQPSGKDRDKGGTIFDTDDRYLFQDTGFPWRTTGKVRTAGGWGSGTTIGPRHVLTASHVVNWDGDGARRRRLAHLHARLLRRPRTVGRDRRHRGDLLGAGAGHR